jgi:beta-lactamase regulating signal transducer with metallopeptidase domain/tetratricopeptide (TPR) repeat protein
MNLPTSDLAGLAWSQIWQVTALAAVVGLATRLFCRRRPHLAYMLWMLVVLKCLTPPLWSSPTGLFSWAQVCSAPPSVENRLPAAVADVATPEARTKSSVERMLRPQKRSAATPSVAVKPEAGESAFTRVESAARVDRPEPPRAWSLSWAAVVAAIWMGGVVALAAVLLWKWMAFARILRHSGRPADPELALLAARTAERLGLRRAIPLRIVSEQIGPAVFGLWRPVVVLPQAIVAGTLRVPSASRSQHGERHTECACYGEEVKRLEPILAHELAHVHRGDAFAGLLQMIAQLVWWFHPLVWWANRETCRRREQCCDEEAVTGIGCTGATYARCLLDALELELQPGRGRRRLLSAVPGVGSAEVTTTRLEHIMDDAQRFHRRTPRWIWGVLALAALLVLPGRAIVLAENEEKLSTKGTKREAEGKRTRAVAEHSKGGPTLAEIAKANDAAWAAIRSMDVTFTRTNRETERILSETRLRQTESTGRWLKDGNRERLRQNSTVTCQAKGQKAPIQGFCYDEYYLDGATVRHVQERDRKGSDRGSLSIVDPKPRDDLVGYIYKGPRAAARGDCTISEPEVLRHFRCRYDDPPLTLAEIIAAWKVTLQGKTTTAAKETLWRLHAERPVGNSPQTAGTYIDFYVNADKGFLVQKAVLYTTHSHLIDGKSLGNCRSLEVKEFQSCGDGVFFPKQTGCRVQIGVERISADTTDCLTFVATKLSVNSPLAGDAFDFRFPVGMTVGERDKNNRMGEGEKVYIWGADNKPAQTFASEREYITKWAEPRELERRRKQTEEKLASKDPKDIEQRCIYYMDAKKYDEAIASLTELIAARPEPSLKMQALCRRGGIFLLYRSNNAKAIDDFTEAIRLAKNDAKDGEKDVVGIKAFRALAYAQQDETLDKALADLADVRPPAHDFNNPENDHGDERLACLLRAAIRIYQGKMRSKDAITPQIWQDLSDGYLVQLPGGSPFPDGYAMLGYVMEKYGDRKDVAVARDMRKTAAQVGEKWKDNLWKDMDDDSVAFFDAYHRCLVRLVPEIEQKPNK